jgi:Flp pilus assembly protein CpaB
MTYRVRNVFIAVGLALVAAMLTLLYVTNYKRAVQRGTSSVQVYVAARDMADGTLGSDIVGNHFLRTEAVQRKDVVPGAITSPRQVNSLVVTQPVFAGEQVTMHHFGPLTEQGVAGQLKGTQRAVQIAGDPNQLLAGTLQTGEHVDLVANIHPTGSMQSPATRIVLRNLLVLSAPPAPSASSVGASGTNQVSTILQVTDTQVQRLFYVMKNADWTLELRPALNATDSTSTVETAASILAAGVPK